MQYRLHYLMTDCHCVWLWAQTERDTASPFQDLTDRYLDPERWPAQLSSSTHCVFLTSPLT